MTTSGSASGAHDDGIRLQKVLAAAGVGSRRKCEDLIAEGRVEVDGQTVTQLGTRIHPETAVVRVDGERINVTPERSYLALNKPSGVVCTMSDPEGRPCIGDYFGGGKQRLFHVGRLDTDTEGLLLLTNDGELSNRLTHPSWGIEKEYLAEVTGIVRREHVREVMGGVTLEDGPVVVDDFRIVQTNEGRSLIEITLHEGRNRIVRRLLEHVGFPVRRLLRTRVGTVHLGDMRPGAVRPLTRSELAGLFEAVGL
jgi:23S rRNA pseudouridine2605 synthase